MLFRIPLLFTVLYVGWAWLWGALHVRIRRGRQYAERRTCVDTNSRYKRLNTLLFMTQNILCIASFWSNAPILLKVHDNTTLRVIGLLLLISATIWYRIAIHYLGRNYSPCYDSHVPFELIRNGPYRFVRHPMYGAKLLIGMSLFVISGSAWFIATFIYLFTETIQATRNEEGSLLQALPAYHDYRAQTKAFIPLLL